MLRSNSTWPITLELTGTTLIACSISDNGASKPLTDVEPRFLVAVLRKADQPELASTILSANSSERVNMTSWPPSISIKLNPPRREDILG